ncbi:alpha-D-ribose 1-methylphosphonate 5-triphosphate diphosphatase [Tistrella bauzanensis]|uniref:alpha-D-ribose 1-methylphosphonate 5-triphosphate diphosphatase n=1 Tax=Tistrella TaxID=171436 RepID=UPI0031F61469
MPTPTTAQAMTPGSIEIRGRRLLIDGREPRPGRVVITGTQITVAAGRPATSTTADGADATATATGRVLDVGDLLVTPGMVDLHGDAFERQVMPRPGVHFPTDLGLIDTDRQMAALGITTAAHGITASWEPGLRSLDAAEALVTAIRRLRPELMVDTRIHLRHEVANAAAVPRIARWIADGWIDLLALNDHLPDFIAMRARPEKLAVAAGRSGLTTAALIARIDQLAADRDAQWAGARGLADAARQAGVPLLSHDDVDPAMRSANRAMGARIAEFPLDLATARAAVAAGDAVMVGAPNILRGTSHAGRLDARTAIAEGAATLIASDYSHTAMLACPFVLAASQRLTLGQAWHLVSQAPAQAAGLDDRGRIADGLRADIAMIDDRDPTCPRVALTIAAGRVVHADATGAALLCQ